MKNVLFILAVFIFLFTACKHGPEHDAEVQEREPHAHKEREHTGNPAPEHETDANREPGDSSHDHEGMKISLTAYSENFEIFAEADPFVAGQPSGILAHFTQLPSFKPLKEGKITVRFITSNDQTSHVQDSPIRPGIYEFQIKPQSAGSATIIFSVLTDSGEFILKVPEITVYSDIEEAHEQIESEVAEEANATVFSKEQSWKIDFSTSKPQLKPFGEIIKTIARVEPSQEDEMVISAKSPGIVIFPDENLLEGRSVSNGENLLSISGEGLAESNPEIRYTEAENEYRKAMQNYERAKTLAEDRIISERELLNLKNEYENAKTIFENLKENYSSTGFRISSPMTGFIRDIYVRNGEYVEAGQPVLSIFKADELLLNAEVQRKYISLLADIRSANIRTMHNNRIYSLNDLNGRIISYGKSLNNDNYLIPINLKVENNENLLPGEFVELYLKSVSDTLAIIVPNSSLLEEQGNYFVFVQLTPELFEKRQVHTGSGDGQSTAILKGLSADERIVTRGATFIKLNQSTGTLDAHSGHVH